MSSNDEEPGELGCEPFVEFGASFHALYPAGSRLELEFQVSRKLILAARQWVHLIDGTLRVATGQNRARWQTLFSIAFAEPPVTIVALSRRLSVRWPTLVRTLSNLEADGLIARTANPADGRSRIVELTAAGRAMLARIQPILDPTRAAMLQDLDAADLRRISDLLDRMLRRIAGALPDQDTADGDPPLPDDP